MKESDLDLISKMLDRVNIEYEVNTDNSITLTTESDIDFVFTKAGKLKKLEASATEYVDISHDFKDEDEDE